MKDVPARASTLANGHFFIRAFNFIAANYALKYFVSPALVAYSRELRGAYLYCVISDDRE